MRNNKKTKDAAFSLYLAMMLSVMIPLIWTMIEGARANAIRMRIECAMDLASDSVLAEYNKKLLEDYGLLMIDTAYGTSAGSEEHLLSHLTEYVNKNLNTSEGSGLIFTDLCRLSLSGAELKKLSRGSDDSSSVLRYLALSYMYEKYGAAYVSDTADLITKYGSMEADGEDVGSEFDDSVSAIDSISIAPPEDLEEGTEWVEPAKDDPAPNVKKLRYSGILSLVCKKDYSKKSVNLSKFASSRSLVKGNGMPEEWEKRNSVTDRLMFLEYIMEKSGNYISNNDSSPLRYETEFILCGKDNDNDNLRIIAERLLLIRGAANASTYYSSPSLKEQTSVAAAALSFVTAFPEFKPVYEAALAAAWIYVESLYDVRLLLENKKVPAIKTESEWHYSLNSALGITTAGPEVDSGYDHGLCYQDLLRIMLFSSDEKSAAKRFTDIVEMNMRTVECYAAFRMDDCIAAADIQYVFKSAYGYNLLAGKSFRYM